MGGDLTGFARLLSDAMNGDREGLADFIVTKLRLHPDDSEALYQYLCFARHTVSGHRSNKNIQTVGRDKRRIFKAHLAAKSSWQEANRQKDGKVRRMTKRMELELIQQQIDRSVSSAKLDAEELRAEMHHRSRDKRVDKS